MLTLHAHASAVGLIALLLGASWAAVYLAGGASTFPPHIPYIPIFIAAYRYGSFGAAVTAIVAGIVHGPLLPAEVDAGTPQMFSDWLIRTASFVAIGVFVAEVLRRSRAHSDRALEATRAGLQTSMRDSAFLQTAASEIRTPLTVISGITRTLERPGMVADLGAPLLQSLTRAVDRLDRLSTMSLASVGVLDEVTRAVAEVDLYALLSEVRGELHELNAGGRVTVHLHADAPPVRTQPRLLRFALSALIEVALRSGSTTSPVDVRVSFELERVRIAVRDVGTAFEPGAADSIGLVAARRLVEQLGGTLGLGRLPGRGTEATIVLPRAPRTVRL